jgi:hypothetical protein
MARWVPTYCSILLTFKKLELQNWNWGSLLVGALNHAPGQTKSAGRNFFTSYAGGGGVPGAVMRI